MRSRYDTSARKADDGELLPFVYGAMDHEVVELLCPRWDAVRPPWSYQYLTTDAIIKLLGRSEEYSERLQRAKDEPHCYLELPTQPETTFKSMVYAVGPGGIDELRGHGVSVRDIKRKNVKHELMACLIAASFDYATKTTPDFTVTVDKQPTEKPLPDWPVFWGQTSYHRRRIYIEADCGTEQIRKREAGDNSIETKLEEYLKLDDLSNALIVFTTIRHSRMMAMIETLKDVIDRLGLDHEASESFAFATMKYDGWLTKIPKLTDWAVSGTYQRALGTFSLMKEGK